mgnify:CR=1 FL=1
MTYIGRVDIWFSAFLSAATLVSAFFVINTAYQTRQMYSSLQELRVERDQLTIEWGRLMLERGALSSDMRIDSLARQKMTLRPPTQKQIFLMKRSR